MAAKSEILSLDPANVLRFTGPFNDVVTAQLKLTNITDCTVLFNIKTTAIKAYCVRPNSGTIYAGRIEVVAVMLQPFNFNADGKPKHKFMVQSMFAPDGTFDAEKVWKDAKPDNIVNVVLRCEFELTAGGAAASGPAPAQSSFTAGRAKPPAESVQAASLPQDVQWPLPGNLSWYAAGNDFQKSKQSIRADASGTNETRLYDENRRLASEINNMRKELEAVKEERARLKHSVLVETIWGGPRNTKVSSSMTPLDHTNGDMIQSLLQNSKQVSLFYMQMGAQESLPQDLFTASAQFVEIKELGHGAFGEVHLVKDRANEANVYAVKKVSLKKLAGLVSNDGEQLQKFRTMALDEANKMKSLSFPFVVKVCGSFLEGDIFHIAMEYCDAGTLKNAIKKRIGGDYFPENQLLSWTSQLCMTLVQLHNAKILHRDIKSDNIFMVTNGRTLKLGDFGISKSLESSSILGASTSVGTPTHFSPEFCEGKPYTYKSEVWALGITVYEMAALVLPFHGANIIALGRAISSGQLPTLPTVYSAEFREFVTEKLLHRDEAKRPSMMHVFCDPVIVTSIAAEMSVLQAGTFFKRQE